MATHFCANPRPNDIGKIPRPARPAKRRAKRRADTDMGADADADTGAARRQRTRNACEADMKRADSVRSARNAAPLNFLKKIAQQIKPRDIFFPPT